jgi:propionate CoA-transferase
VLFNAPYADAEGNIYFAHAATITENVQGAQAARANGGQVLATVSAIVPKDEARIGLPAAMVDAIVVHPYNEQTGSVQQRRFWPMFTVGGNVDPREAVAVLKFLNHTLKITPRRGPVENALARLAAARFVQAVPQGAIVNIGVGFPEEVVRLVFEHGLDCDLTFTTETGVYGGLPAPGIFFGAAINPERMEPSSWMFELYRERLGAAVLGFLQVDSAGNVNVSKRGPRMLDYVGPGGFPDIADSARVLIFVGTWMANATFAIEEGRLRITQPGTPKFVERVDEVTLSGREAVRLGKEVYYVTNVGCFRLTEQGLLLIETVPGIDVERDIQAASRARIVLPDGPVPLAPPAVLTGDGFALQWPGAPPPH